MTNPTARTAFADKLFEVLHRPPLASDQYEDSKAPGVFAYSPMRKLDKFKFRKHIEGERTLAITARTEDGRCAFLAFDIDENFETEARKLLDHLEELEENCLLLSGSAPGRGKVVVLLPEPVSWYLAQHTVWEDILPGSQANVDLKRVIPRRDGKKATISHTNSMRILGRNQSAGVGPVDRVLDPRTWKALSWDAALRKLERIRLHPLSGSTIIHGYSHKLTYTTISDYNHGRIVSIGEGDIKTSYSQTDLGQIMNSWQSGPHGAHKGDVLERPPFVPDTQHSLKA
jgi:hypothetical protein